MGGGGVLNIVIHGVIRTATTLGQSFAKGSASAPIQIGPKGGIIVEGITPDAVAGSVVQTDNAITDTSAVIMTANPTRSYELFQNTGSNTVWLNFDAPAVANSGIRLIPGAVWEPTVIMLGEVEAICDTGLTSSIVVVEA